MTTAIFYNKILDILGNYSFDDSNEWVRDMFLPKKNNAAFSSTDDLLADLFKDFNFSNFQLPGFWFKPRPFVDNLYISIGSRDTDNICIDRETQEVLFFTEDDELIGYLAGSLSDYLSVLLLMIEYHLPGFMGHIYTDRDNLNVLTKIKMVLGSEKYFPFYEDTYGSF